MSIEAMVWVLNNSGSRSTDRLVLLVLANYANDDGEAWPSGRTLEAKAAVSRHTVIDALERCVGAGEIELVQAGAPKRSARYRFTYKKVVDNSGLSGADTRRSPETSGADTRLSGADTRLSGAPVAPDPLRTDYEPKTAAAAGSRVVGNSSHETADERGRRLAAMAARARNAAELAADLPPVETETPEPMTGDEIAAVFETVEPRDDEPVSDGARRARGIRSELRDNAREHGAPLPPIRDTARRADEHGEQLRRGLVDAAERLYGPGETP